MSCDPHANGGTGRGTHGGRRRKRSFWKRKTEGFLSLLVFGCPVSVVVFDRRMSSHLLSLSLQRKVDLEADELGPYVTDSPLLSSPHLNSALLKGSLPYELHCLQIGRARKTTMAQTLQFALFLLFLIVSGGPGMSSADRNFNIVNRCSFDVWPATLSNAGMPTLWQGGVSLPAGEQYNYVAPTSWAGRVWGRSGCNFDSSGAGTCITGDCGGVLYCDGAGGLPPATLAEFTLDGDGGQDFYDVSLVDGYNLPLSIETGGAKVGTCGNPGCTSDLNLSCPSELKVMDLNGAVVACKSACEAFQEDQYCCTGAFNSPSTCPPTSYSMTFKNACPTAYSYAYDDPSSTFTCQGTPDYTITFCPTN